MGRLWQGDTVQPVTWIPGKISGEPGCLHQVLHQVLPTSPHEDRCHCSILEPTLNIGCAVTPAGNLSANRHIRHINEVPAHYHGPKPVHLVVWHIPFCWRLHSMPRNPPGTPTLVFKKKRPLQSLLQGGHLCLTASQGSFGENSFLSVEIIRPSLTLVSTAKKEFSNNKPSEAVRRKCPSWRRRDRSGLFFLKKTFDVSAPNHVYIVKLGHIQK